MYKIKNLIEKKSKHKSYKRSELNFIVDSYIKNQISDIHMTEWLKSIIKYDMTFDETSYYTDAIIKSGNKIRFDNLDGYIVDKHSTGGIGDKVSLILGPILAACGCYVPMIVGRMLAHTGGTLDKLESIEGYNGLIELEKFKKIVRDTGISIIGQTSEICPADGKIYNLRGRTNTVSSLPLICGSIMSKKIAEGINGLVLDIKTGNGAFIKKSSEAEKLGNLLSKIGKKFGVDVKYIQSNMDQPLGKYAGLLCEVKESIDCLKGRGDIDMMNLTFKLAEEALSLSKIRDKKLIFKVIEDGSALEIFNKMIHSHGGNFLKTYHSYKYHKTIKSSKKGLFKYINMIKIGEAVNFLTITNGKTDINAGIKFYKKNNQHIDKNDHIMKIFSNNKKNINIANQMLKGSFTIS